MKPPLFLRLLGAATLLVAAPLTAQSPASAQGDWLSLDTILTVGLEEDASETYSFGSVIGMAVDSLRDRIVVLDGINSEVKVFSSTGAHLKTLGGPGAGPGEYRLPYRVAVDREGQIFVYDVRLNRITTYSRDFELLRTFPSGFAQGGSMIALDDHIVASGISGGLGNVKTIHVLDKETGQTIRSFGNLAPARNDRVAMQIGVGGVTASRDGLWYTDRVPYRATRYSMEGTLNGRFERPGNLVPVPTEITVTEPGRDGRLFLRYLVYPVALHFTELPDGWGLSQANLMEGGMVTDLWNGRMELVASQRGPMPGLRHWLAPDLVAVSVKGRWEQQGWALLRVVIHRPVDSD